MHVDLKPSGGFLTSLRLWLTPSGAQTNLNQAERLTLLLVHVYALAVKAFYMYYVPMAHSFKQCNLF